MAILLIAEHDNAGLKDATHKALTAAKQMGGDVHVLVAGNKADGAAKEAAGLDGVSKVLHCDAPLRRTPAGEAHGRPDRLADGQLRRDGCAGHHQRQEHQPARGRLLDEMQVSGITAVKSLTRSSVRSMPAMPSRRCRPPVPRRSSRCSLPRLRQPVPVVRLNRKGRCTG
jgi:electron transfer flavoprotein alpha subunit